MSDLTCNTEDALLDAETAPPVREGLPSGYRMRADAHYIEQLDMPTTTVVQSIPVRAIDGADDAERPSQALIDSITSHGVLEPLLVQKREARYRLITGRRRLIAARASGLVDVPCLVHRVSDEEARRIAAAAAIARESERSAEAPDHSDAQDLIVAEDAVQRSLAGIVSCTPLLHDGLPALTRAVALDMVTAEAHRATCALTVMRVLKRGVAAASQPTSAQDVVQRLVDRVSPDLRLRGMVVDTAMDAGGALAGDAEQLACTLAAVVFILAATLERGSGARLSISATRDDGWAFTIAIEQEGVVLPDAWIALAADGRQEQVQPELMPLLALRRIAEAYGGRLTASRLRRAGRVAIELPARDE